MYISSFPVLKCSGYSSSIFHFDSSTISSVSVWSHHMSRWLSRHEELNCIPTGKLEEITWKSLDYINEDSSRQPQVLQSHIYWSSQCGSEMSIQVTVGFEWHYAVLVVLVRNDDYDDDDHMQMYRQHLKHAISKTKLHCQHHVTLSAFSADFCSNDVK